MADIFYLSVCFLIKRAVAGAIAGAIIGAIPFYFHKNVKIYGISISVVAVISAFIGFELNVC